MFFVTFSVKDAYEVKDLFGPFISLDEAKEKVIGDGYSIDGSYFSFFRISHGGSDKLLKVGHVLFHNKKIEEKF